MMGLIVAIHVIICALLIIIILIQAGRGGGLVEGFTGVESMFGTKTNAFLTRTTTTLAILFFITCISLAALSARQSRSLMRGVKPQAPAAEPQAAKQEAPKQEAPKQETAETQNPPQPQEKQEAPKAE